MPISICRKKRLGASAAEMATLLVVVVLLAGTLSFLGRQTNDSMERVSAITDGDRLPPTFAGQQSGLDAAEHPLRELVELTPTSLEWWVRHRRFLALYVSVVLNFALWYLMITRNRREARKRAADQKLDRLSRVSPDDVLHRKRRQILHVLENSFADFANGRMTVQTIMTHSVTTCLANDKARDVLMLMKEKRIRQVVVCNSNREMVGVLSRTDISHVAQGTVQELMSSEPITVQPDTPIAQALHAFTHHGISSLPVTTDDGTVCGLVTKTDVLMILECVQLTLAANKDVWSKMDFCTQWPDSDGKGLASDPISMGETDFEQLAGTR